MKARNDIHAGTYGDIGVSVGLVDVVRGCAGVGGDGDTVFVENARLSFARDGDVV